MQNDFYIARWHVQPQRNRIAGAQAAAQVEPKIMQVLVYLAGQAGEVVSREEILDAVWPDVVVGEEVVSRAISELRKVFGDNPRSPAVIETIPKAGYRLMAPVSYDEVGGDHVPEPGFSVPSFERARPARQHVSTPWIVVAAIGLVLILGSVGAWLILSQAPPPEPTHLVQTSPLTTSPGFEFAPALSPNGRQAAFIWTGGLQNGPLNVYVKLIGAGAPLQLTDSPLYEWSPTWSPDGREVAFARSLHGLFVVPALGGPERKLTDIGSTSRPDLDWSPSGNLIAFTDRETAQAPYRTYLYAFDTGTVQPLTTPPALYHGDEAPSFSPDGQVIAFARATDQASDLYVVPISGGPARRLTTDHARIAGLTWTPDGAHVIFSSNRGGTYGLWRIPVAGGEPQPVALSAIGNLREPALRGEVLTYTESYTDVNIWQYDLMDTTATPTPWLASTRWDADPQFAPDGQRIAFASARSGHAEIWVADRAGSDALQLTSFEGPHTGHPRWSPDGERLAFDSREAGHADIYLIDASGGVPQRLTTDPASDLLPSWSGDGTRVYFASNRSGTWQVWQIPAAGGEAVPVTQHGGYAAVESPEGSFIYYTRRDTSGLWRTAPNSQEKIVIDAVDVNDWGHWSVTAQGLYFLHAASRILHRYDFTTRHSSPIRTLAHRPSWQQAGIAVAPHDTALLVTQTDQSYYDIVVTAYMP